jgi:hypothetical protein
MPRQGYMQDAVLSPTGNSAKKCYVAMQKQETFLENSRTFLFNGHM